MRNEVVQEFMEEWINDILSVYEEVSEGSIYKDLIMGYLDDKSFHGSTDTREIAKSFFKTRFENTLLHYKGNTDRAYDLTNVKEIMYQFYLYANEGYRLATLSIRDMVDVSCGGEFLRRIGYIERDLKGVYNTLQKMFEVIEGEDGKLIV